MQDALRSENVFANEIFPHVDGAVCTTECPREFLESQPLRRRDVTAKFDAPTITLDIGGVLLRETDERYRFVNQRATFTADYRSSTFTIDPLLELLVHRVFDLSLGDKDLNDHDQLGSDGLITLLAGKSDPVPIEGFTLTGKSTFNR